MMNIQFKKSQPNASLNKAYLLTEKSQVNEVPLNDNERAYVKDRLDKEINFVMINRYNGWIFIVNTNPSKGESAFLEDCRRKGNEINAQLRKEKIANVELIGIKQEADALIALAEGIALGSYDFSKYNTKSDEKSSVLKEIFFSDEWIPTEKINELGISVEALFMVRDLVNEPVSYLNAEKLSETFEAMGKEAGFTTEIFDREKIEALKMGGLLAVNKGSIDPPTFSVLEWNPDDAKNSKPIVLVGKGITFDTGGLSLKPTPNSMDSMKSDMAGGATVAAVIYASAKMGLPVHLIALIPATDNRPDGNALTPGDIIYTHSGKSVEVLNTDAEGRLILADALSFAKKYNPVLVIDAATLTGSAAMAIGQYGIVAMGTAEKTTFDSLKKSGEKVYERIVEFPFWDEYDELIKSDIADIKNIGGREGGAITAGKFLANFVDYPWIHLDIAGPAFLQNAEHYRGKGGTGTGFRLLLDFVRKFENLKI
jgi:leucyl aminopeptidase